MLSTEIESKGAAPKDSLPMISVATVYILVEGERVELEIWEDYMIYSEKKESVSYLLPLLSPNCFFLSIQQRIYTLCYRFLLALTNATVQKVVPERATIDCVEPLPLTITTSCSGPGKVIAFLCLDHC